MESDFTSAWLMYSIVHSENEHKYSKLIDIIAIADYSNHAILTYLEFNEGLTLLLNLGFIRLKDDKLFVSESFKQWWTAKFVKKKRRYVQKEILDINEHISKLKSSLPKKVDLPIISESDFNKAVNEYLDKMKNILHS